MMITSKPAGGTVDHMNDDHMYDDHFQTPIQVALLTTCMTTPDDSTCTINAVSTSLPLKVTRSSFS